MQRGIWCGIAAYVLWGIVPIFWNLVEGIPALELLANRIFWSLPLLVIAISIRRRWVRLVQVYRDRQTVALALLCSLLIAVNWGVFVWAVTVVPLLLFGASAQRIPLSTLGLLQFLAPTLQFLIGVLIYGEELLPAQLFGFTMVWIALIAFAGDSVRTTRALERPASL